LGLHDTILRDESIVTGEKQIMRIELARGDAVAAGSATAVIAYRGKTMSVVAPSHAAAGITAAKANRG